MKAEHRATAVENEVKVLELAKAGYTFRQIADQLGYAGPSSAHHAFKRVLARTIVPAVDDYRKLQLARYEHVVRANWHKMVTGDGDAARVIMTALKGIADLLGLNAPKEIKVAHEMQALADRVAEDLGLNTADILAEAERIIAAAGAVA